MRLCWNKFIQLKWSIKVLLIWGVISLLAPIIANDKAIFRIDEDGISFPICTTGKYTNTPTFEILPLINSSPQYMDYAVASPSSPRFTKSSVENKRHILGTDHLGRDVLSNLIYGSRTAFLIGFGSMLLAALIGILIGGIAAYFGDNSVRINRNLFISLIISVFLFGLLATTLIPWNISSIGTFEKLLQLLLILGFCSFIFFLSSKIPFIKNSTRINFPVDLTIGRLIDVMESIPLLFLLIALSTIFIQSVSSVIIVIGLVAWPTIAKYTRAEFLRVKNTTFIENSVALGFPRRKIIFKHILSNAINPVLVTLAFGLGSAILLESTLSFLGLGIDSETASWGKMLASARQYYQAWWLVVFPGIALFISVVSCNSVGDYLSKQE